MMMDSMQSQVESGEMQENDREEPFDKKQTEGFVTPYLSLSSSSSVASYRKVKGCH